LVVDCERGDLLDELEEVDGAVEERRLELALKINLRTIFLLLEAVDVVGDVDKGDNVDRELAENRRNDVPVPDVVLWALFGELFDGLRVLATDLVYISRGSYLCARYAQETHTHKHPTNCHLSISKLDTIQIKHTQAVSADQAIQRQDLVHLDGGHKRASSLSNDVRNRDNIGEFAGERRSDRSITKFDSRRFVVAQSVAHQ
jgi:hypothetical protein